MNLTSLQECCRAFKVKMFLMLKLGRKEHFLILGSFHMVTN